jgi:hypothetical protein
MTFITIFTAPKPFKDAHISIIQRNAIQSWISLGSEVEVILMGKEEGMAEVAAELDVKHRPDVACNHLGTPMISSMYDLARRSNDSPLLLCINADIILLPDMLDMAHQIAKQTDQFLALGQRWDLDIQQPVSFTEGWVELLRSDVQQRGKAHPPVGSDYFLFPRSCYTHIPNFVIGRSAWDNWMIYYGRLERIPVVDVTPSTMVIHQNHDYSHLPGGKPPYHLPETMNNIRLAGGRRTIFHIPDADCYLKDGQLRHIPIRGRKLWREIEIYPLIRLRSQALAEISFAIFHPIMAWKEWRGRIAFKLGHLQGSND